MANDRPNNSALKQKLFQGTQLCSLQKLVNSIEYGAENSESNKGKVLAAIDIYNDCIRKSISQQASERNIM